MIAEIDIRIRNIRELFVIRIFLFVFVFVFFFFLENIRIRIRIRFENFCEYIRIYSLFEYLFEYIYSNICIRIGNS